MVYSNWQIQGTTLVAMHLYEDLLEVLSVEWTEWYPQCRGNKRASGVSGVRQQQPSLTPKLRLHFLLLQPLNSFTSPVVAHARSCIVKGLAFIGASEGSDQGALDVKRRPLLVVLFSQRGRQISPFPSLFQTYISSPQTFSSLSTSEVL